MARWLARWLSGTRCGSPLPPLAGQAAWALDLQEQMGGRLDVVLHNPVRSPLLLQLIRLIGAEGLNRRPPAGSCRLFLGPGFRLGACWNRLGETVKTRKKRGKTGKEWARYGLTYFKTVKDLLL